MLTLDTKIMTTLSLYKVTGGSPWDEAQTDVFLVKPSVKCGRWCLRPEKHMRWCFYFAAFSSWCFADWENSLNYLRLMGKDESGELIDQLEPVVYCIKYLQVGASDDSCSGSSAFAAKAHSLQKNLWMDLGCASPYVIYCSTREPLGHPRRGYL